jgi:hypothetical protein
MRYLKDYFVKKITVILEDNRRFSSYYKKSYPRTVKVLLIAKLACFFLFLFAMHADFKSYLQYFVVYQEQSILPNDTHSFSSYALSLYLFLVFYEFILSLYIIQNLK